MFTVCPKCALTLVVTAADLRIAQGYVRCGRCSSVFNALARLSEERGLGAPAGPAEGSAGGPDAGPVAAPDPTPSPTAPTAAPPGAAPPWTTELRLEEEPIPEDALEFNPETTDVNSVFVQPPPDPVWAAATGSFRSLVAANQEAPPGELLPDSQVDVEIDADFLASMLTESAAADAAPAPAVAAARPEAARPQARTVAPRAAPAAAPAAPQAIAPGRPATGAAATVPAARARAPLFDTADADGDGVEVKEERFKAREAEEPADESSTLEAPAPSRLVALLRPQGWRIGAALAALVLLAQIVNHYRDELAVNARFNRPLTALYGAFGVKLFPHWDLHAYDVRQLGASAGGETAGMITVRATIKNEAPQPQPLPLLRVTLQDRFGNRIAARDVQPKGYLPGAVPPASFLSAGQRIDAEMGFADPGTDAVGFEIDACLPARGGTACANDTALR